MPQAPHVLRSNFVLALLSQGPRCVHSEPRAHLHAEAGREAARRQGFGRGRGRRTDVIAALPAARGSSGGHGGVTLQTRRALAC